MQRVSTEPAMSTATVDGRYASMTVLVVQSYQTQNVYVFYILKRILNNMLLVRDSSVVKVLCYKSEGRWFDPSWCQWVFH